MTFHSSILRALGRRPWLVTLGVVALLAAWGGWTASQLLMDQAVSSDKVSAQRLRVNTVQLQTVQKAIESYRHPASIPTSPVSPFGTPAPLTTP